MNDNFKYIIGCLIGIFIGTVNTSIKISFQSMDNIFLAGIIYFAQIYVIYLLVKELNKNNM